MLVSVLKTPLQLGLAMWHLQLCDIPSLQTGGYRQFGGACCRHHEGTGRSERQNSATKLHGVKTMRPQADDLFSAIRSRRALLSKHQSPYCSKENSCWLQRWIPGGHFINNFPIR